MCRWTGSHFHDWVAYNGRRILNGVTKMGSHIFGFLQGKTVLHIYGEKKKVFFIHFKQWVTDLSKGLIRYTQQKLTQAPLPLGRKRQNLCDQLIKYSSCKGNRA